MPTATERKNVSSFILITVILTKWIKGNVLFNDALNTFYIRLRVAPVLFLIRHSGYKKIKKVRRRGSILDRWCKKRFVYHWIRSACRVSNVLLLVCLFLFILFYFILFFCFVISA